MIDEPNITPDDTNPSRVIRVEEPPIQEGDTSPSRRVSPPVYAKPQPPVWGLRILTGGIAIAIVIALGIFGIVIMNGNGDDSPAPAPTGQPTLSAQESAHRATTTPGNMPATTEADRESASGGDTVATGDQDSTPDIRATAAADEIAAALLTPAPNAPDNGEVVRASAPFTIRDNQTRTQVVEYTVQEGDTLESIANQFGLEDFYTLVWSNKPSHYSPLSPGNALNIMPEDGVYHELTENITIGDLAALYEVDPYAIIDSEYNDHLRLFGTTPDTMLPAGAGWVAIPGGKGEQINLLAALSSGSGGTVSNGVISGTYTLWGCTANISGGTYPALRPLDAYTFMQDYHEGHTAVDLAPKSGTVGDPIKASGAGTVVYSGWNNYGYGNVVVVAHGSAFTLYAHLHTRAVNCGQSVQAGQTIGTLGNSGNSTGPHLHFEIRDANFVPRNPRYDISF